MAMFVESRRECLERMHEDPRRELENLYGAASIVPNPPRDKPCLYNGGYHESNDDLRAPCCNVVSRGHRRRNCCLFCGEILRLIRESRKRRGDTQQRLCVREGEISTHLQVVNSPICLQRTEKDWIADSLTSQIMLSYCREHPRLIKVYFTYLCEGYRVVITDRPIETLEEYLIRTGDKSVAEDVPALLRELYNGAVFTADLSLPDVVVMDGKLSLNIDAPVSWQLPTGELVRDEFHENIDFGAHTAEEEAAHLVEEIKNFSVA